MMVEGWKGVVILVMFAMVSRDKAADLVIRVPETSTQQKEGYYRLDYTPPVGSPASNTTFKLSDLGDAINFSEGLPGSEYNFYLYYSNSSITDSLIWTASIMTAPDPPTKLTVDVHSGTQARLEWRPPKLGKYSKFKLQLVPFSEPSKSESYRSISVQETTSTLTDLTPGATYEIRVYSVLAEKTSHKSL